ncbi:uncharacterized protein LOC129754595 [Uranotaenia lowii]|uniref:uncharacterized protein LOC129754595 n=1 Tax=Uranotaenia lowii TaxID=190385 RepID=UPI00247920F5|nr:uncharacterized protein LOC129754595 [Uranotaenia lowii]
MFKFGIFLLAILMVNLHTATCRVIEKKDYDNDDLLSLVRAKRQFSLNLGATHQDNEGTDFTAEAIARFWRSQSGNTEVQGSASYSQHFGGFQGDGNDYRLKLKVVFL